MNNNSLPDNKLKAICHKIFINSYYKVVRRWIMYNYGYPQGGYGCGCPCSGNTGSSWGGVFAFILVLFILLVIIGFGTNNCLNNNQMY